VFFGLVLGPLVFFIFVEDQNYLFVYLLVLDLKKPAKQNPLCIIKSFKNPASFLKFLNQQKKSHLQ
jgi:hypothetical protein